MARHESTRTDTTTFSRFGRLLIGAAAVLPLLTLGCYLNARSAESAQHSAVQWGEDLTEALTAADVSNQPVLLVFSATWCPPCQEMKRSVWSRADVAQAVHRSYLPVNLDIDSEAGQVAARRYAVNSIPTVLVLSADGNVIRGAEFMSTDKTLAFLTKR